MHIKIISLCLAFIAFNAHAQVKQVEDSTSKGRQKGFSIHTDSINKATAYKAVIKTIADHDRKVFASILSDELFFDNAGIPFISASPIDIYARFNEKDTCICLFVDLGTAFADSAGFPKEAAAIRRLCIDIKSKAEKVKRQDEIDSLKWKLKLLETRLKKVNDTLRLVNSIIKSNTRGAAKDDREVAETQTELIDARVQIKAIDSLVIVRQEEFNAFPLRQLKAVNSIKSNSLGKNRKTRRNLISDNLKSEEKIIGYETEIVLNESSLEVVEDDPKATKAFLKANRKLSGKIKDERLNIALNNVRLKAISVIIAADSNVLKVNDDSLAVFDEEGRLRELKQLAGMKKKLEGKTVKHESSIEEAKLESEQKKKEAGTASLQIEALKARQAQLARELETAKLHLLSKEKE